MAGRCGKHCRWRNQQKYSEQSHNGEKWIVLILKLCVSMCVCLCYILLYFSWVMTHFLADVKYRSRKPVAIERTWKKNDIRFFLYVFYFYFLSHKWVFTLIWKHNRETEGMLESSWGKLFGLLVEGRCFCGLSILSLKENLALLVTHSQGTIDHETFPHFAQRDGKLA